MKKILTGMVLSIGVAWGVEVGTVPPKVVLQGADGGTVEGKRWDSNSLRGKIHILFYVDPDERERNAPLTHALKARGFDHRRFGSVAVVNLAATWLPNVVLESLLKKKQKQFPYTRYVKDRHKVLVKAWDLADDNSDVLLFDRKGKLLYQKFGTLSKEEIASLITLIEKHL